MHHGTTRATGNCLAEVTYSLASCELTVISDAGVLADELIETFVDQMFGESNMSSLYAYVI